MRDHERTKPLFRKVNTRAHGVHHRKGGDYRHERNSKREKSTESDEVSRGSMHGIKRRGLDYTPLFRFLLSNVGEEWEKVRREAVERLDTTEPIYWMVARNEHEKKPYIRTENAIFSGLYIDESGKLAKVAPDLRNEDLMPHCSCCTHTFNGVALVRKYESAP